MDLVAHWKETWLLRLKNRIARYFLDLRLSEAALLQRELDQLDQNDPDWDKAAHRAALRAGLEDGASRDHPVRLYGEDAVREEEAAILQEEQIRAFGA